MSALPLRRQLIALSAAATAVAMVILVVLLHLVLHRISDRAVDRVLADRIDAVAGSAELTSGADRLVVPDARLDAGVAVYDARGDLVAGSPPVAQQEQYAELSGVHGGRTVTVGESSVIRAESFVLDGGVTGVVVASERLAPYEDSEHYALVVSLATGLVAVLVSAALAAFVSRRALAPVVAMAAAAEEWSEHDLTSRFQLSDARGARYAEGTRKDELSVLGATLDSLLDKVATAIRSEQRITAELAHELRTPLTTVSATADLMALRPDLDPEVAADVEELRAAARRMAETIAALLELARAPGGSAARGSCVLTDVVADVLGDLGPRGRSVRVEGDSTVRLGLPGVLAARVLGPVVDNAVRHGPVVTVRSLGPVAGDRVRVAVDDDGAGIDPDVGERVFDAGYSSGSEQGSGLGLALARRVARAAGGDVRLDVRDGPGARFVIELPAG